MPVKGHNSCSAAGNICVLLRLCVSEFASVCVFYLRALTQKKQKNTNIIWRIIWDAVQSSLPPPTADGPGVIPSFPLACVCCCSLNALPSINTHRITNVINSQPDFLHSRKRASGKKRVDVEFSAEDRSWTRGFLGLRAHTGKYEEVKNEPVLCGVPQG